MDESSQRRAVRLNVAKGSVSLWRSDLPALACALRDLSEGGCRVGVSREALEREAALGWREALVAGQNLEVEVSCPEVLERFRTKGQIRKIELASEGGTEVGLLFLDVAEPERQRLQRALLVLATLKVRTAFQGSTRESATQYLVGAASTPRSQRTVPPPPRPPGVVPAAPPGAGSTPAPAAPAPSDAAGRDGLRGRRLGEVLTRMGKLAETQVEGEVQQAARRGERLGQHLVACGKLTSQDLYRALSLQSGVPLTDLSGIEALPERALSVFPTEILRRRQFVTIDVSPHVVCIATANPLPRGVMEVLTNTAGRKVEQFLACEEHVTRLLRTLHTEKKQPQRMARHTIRLPVTYYLCDEQGRHLSDVSHRAQTLDLSESGIRMEGPAPEWTGSADTIEQSRRRLEVTVILPGASLTVLCSIRSAKARESVRPGEMPWTFGLHIESASAEDRQRIRQVCIRAGMANARKQFR